MRANNLLLASLVPLILNTASACATAQVSQSVPSQLEQPLQQGQTVAQSVPPAQSKLNQPGYSLREYIRPDGKREIYYTAGDEFLAAGIDLLNRYWSNVATKDRNVLRGQVDNYLPLALQQLDYKPAEAMMRLFADSFFAARSPQTGLIPFSYNAKLPNTTVRAGGKQPVYLIERGAEFLQWFPSDQSLRQKNIALAKAMIKYFNAQGGVQKWVDVTTGDPTNLNALTQDYGSVGKGFAYLTKLTGDRTFINWADQKMNFIWNHRLNSSLPVLADDFTPTGLYRGPRALVSDTDTLYYVRRLFDIYALTGNTKYRDWAMATTNLWYNNAWNPQYGHFIRKLNPDGTPAVDQLYGDAKYNTLHILVEAYRVTKDVKYLNRLKTAWNNLVEMGENGFVAQRMAQGEMVEEQGLDRNQTMYLAILLNAYDVSGDQEFLRQAEALGQRILKAGDQYMRMDGGQAGQAFLRLGLARQSFRRVEVALPTPSSKFIVKRDNQTLLEVNGSSPVAVVYIPATSVQTQLQNSSIIKDTLVSQRR